MKLKGFLKIISKIMQEDDRFEHNLKVITINLWEEKRTHHLVAYKGKISLFNLK